MTAPFLTADPDRTDRPQVRVTIRGKYHVELTLAETEDAIEELTRALTLVRTDCDAPACTAHRISTHYCDYHEGDV